MSMTVADGPSATDIVNGDGNEPSLVDTQYSIFSLIAILYFVGLFVTNLDKYAAGAVTAGNSSGINAPRLQVSALLFRVCDPNHPLNVCNQDSKPGRSSCFPEGG